VDVSSAKSKSASEEVLFRDGLGDRLLIRDKQGRPTHESLLIRPDLTSVPSFEFALNERIWLVEKFDHPAFLTIRNIVRVPGRVTTISLVHDLTGGTRLSDVLARAESSGQPTSVAATVFVLKEVLSGIAELHRQSGDLAHGALAPERIVLADGRVRIADYVLGAAIEQLRFPIDRYWKELRVGVPTSAGSSRIDRRADVAQIGMIGVAMFIGRPLRDPEHLGGLGDVLMSISVPQPIRSWLLRALHMDPRRVFVHGGEALQALDEAIAEAGLRPSGKELDLQTNKPLRLASPVTTRSPSASMPSTRPPSTSVSPRLSSPLKKPAVSKPKRDAWQAHDVESRQVAHQGGTVAPRRRPVSAGFKKFLWAAMIVITMTGAFTAAQFVPPPEWLFSTTGTLVIESNPQGVPVRVNGRAHGITPLTLKVEAGIHEVELRGPGKPRIFKVHVTRGDRVAQYIEFRR
jgi:serine/threonine protein kinase